MGGFIDAVKWMVGLVRATLRPRPRIPIWQWADENVVVPEESGGPRPGQLQTRRFAIFRGLYDLVQMPTTRHFAMCASARVGKTLFSIVLFLYWIAERVGAVAWLDPSAQSAKKFVRSELEHFIMKCPQVRKLAIISRTTWTTLWKSFRGKIARILGSGAEADMHGFNCELAIINEADRCRMATKADASSPAKIEARTRLFPHTRLIVKNSTPGAGGEFSPIWQEFLRGSQHYCYLPCPHCSEKAQRKLRARKGKRRARPAISRPPGWAEESMEEGLDGWQRLSFSVEKKLVPFGRDLRPLRDKRGKLKARDQWREETTGQFRFDQFAKYEMRKSPFDARRKERVKTGYDMEGVERGTVYQCAHCRRDIDHTSLKWMLSRYRWVAHNPFAPADRISAHVWAGYSPFEVWGLIAKEFLEAKDDLASLIKLHNLVFGIPFVRQGSAVKEDDLDRVIHRTPKQYVKGELPFRPELLTMAVDKQGGGLFWYSIRAWGLIENHADLPSWNALVDWGQAHSWDELLEKAGLKAREDGTERRFVFTDAAGVTTEHLVTAGIVDSGHEMDLVYKFCLRNNEVFSPYKGGPPKMTGGNPIRVTKAMDEQIDLLLCWSDYFCHNLYYDCLKFGQVGDMAMNWWLPTDIDEDYRKQLTDEYRSAEGWVSRTDTNHLGDTEKMHRVLSDKIETALGEVRADRLKARQTAGAN